MRLLNINRRLPGGWRYKQFDSAGVLLHEWKQDFDPWSHFIAKVRDFRVRNHLVRQDINFVESDVMEYLAREFGGDPRYFTQDPEAQKKTTNTRHYRNRSGSLAGIAASAGKIFTGTAILRDWLGSGLKPVPNAEAQNRSDVCTGRLSGVRCPHNGKGLGLIEFAASRFRAMVEAKNEMKLTAIGEEQLDSCQLCLCDLKLKIHVPMETIIEHTPSAMFDKFNEQAPQNCWMRNTNPAP